jgi:hypothetical protein
MSGSAIKVALLATCLFAVCLLVSAPFTAAPHNHLGDESKDKCLACLHAFLSLEPSESHPDITFQLSTGGTLGFSSESKTSFEPHATNSVRAPPVA